MAGSSELFRRPHFLFAVLAQFLYVGAQVGTWSYFIQYVQDYTHQPEKRAGLFSDRTLVAFAVGASLRRLMRHCRSAADDALCHREYILGFSRSSGQDGPACGLSF